MTKQERLDCFKYVNTNDVLSGFNNKRIESKKRQKNAGDSYASRLFASMSETTQKQLKKVA